MQDFTVSSCALCLQPDETEVMIVMEFHHGVTGSVRGPFVCRSCARGIAEAWQAIQADEAAAALNGQEVEKA